MLIDALSTNASPEQILQAIKRLDMTTEVKRLFDGLQKETITNATSPRAALLDIVNTQTHNLTIGCTQHGNISLKSPHGPLSSELYSVPGHSVLFAINNQSFTVDLYALAHEHVTPTGSVVVSEGNPLMVDGRCTLFDCTPAAANPQAFIGSINLPDQSADISVFDRQSLRKIAWIPHDDGAARFLVSLELLEATQDPGIGTIAEELIYHYHPAVAWKAFQTLYQFNRQTALDYVPLLRQLKNRRLDSLLDQYGKVA